MEIIDIVQQEITNLETGGILMAPPLEQEDTILTNLVLQIIHLDRIHFRIVTMETKGPVIHVVLGT